MTLCATCSSSDRSLVSISDVHWRILISVIGKGIPEAVYKLRNSLNLCFECNARIHNMCKFRENAIKSLQALQYHVKNINELKFTPTLGFACGSQMSVGPQDVDCISHSPEQNVSTEIKCVEDESMLSNVDMEPDKDPFQEKPIKEEIILTDDFQSILESNVMNNTDKILENASKSQDCLRSMTLLQMLTNKKEMVLTNSKYLFPAESLDEIRTTPVTSDSIKQQIMSDTTASYFSKTLNNTIDFNESTSYNVLAASAQLCHAQQNEEDLSNNSLPLFRVRRTLKEAIDCLHRKRNGNTFRDANHKCYSCAITFDNEGAAEVHRLLHAASRSKDICPVCTQRCDGCKSLLQHMNEEHWEVFRCKTCRYESRSEVKMRTHKCSEYIMYRKWNELPLDEVTENHSAKERKTITLPKNIKTKTVKDIMAELSMLPPVNSSELNTNMKTMLSGKIKNSKTPIERIEKILKTYERMKISYSLRYGKTRIARAAARKLKISLSCLYQTIKKYSNTHTLRKSSKICGTSKNSEIKTKLTPMICDHCHRRFMSRSALIYHMKSHEPFTSSDAVYCHLCDATFYTRKRYECHVNTSMKHQKTFKYECEKCKRKFITEKNLKQHIQRMHTTEGNYSCTQCVKTFNNEKYLQRHTKRIHEITNAVVKSKNHLCDVCAKKFTNVKSLTEHLNTHTGIRPHICKLCPSTFAYSAALFNHNRLVHLKQKLPIKKKNNSKEDKNKTKNKEVKLDK